jgi:CRP-like cAMP-binding protein
MGLFRKDTKIEALKGVPLFSGLSKKEIGELARVSDELDAQAGKVFTREGESGREFFVLLEGEVDVTRGGVLVEGGPRDFFGEVSLLEDTPRTATVTARTPIRFVVLTRAAFRQVCHGSPLVEEKVRRALSERTR